MNRNITLPRVLLSAAALLIPQVAIAAPETVAPAAASPTVVAPPPAAPAAPAPSAAPAPKPAEVADTLIAATGFDLAHGNTAAPAIPLDELRTITLPLSRLGNTYYPCSAPQATSLASPAVFTRITLGETFPLGTRFSTSALREILGAIVEHYNKRGISGVFAVVDSGDIDPGSREDTRATGRTKLGFVIWSGRVGVLRTVARGPRFPQLGAVNNPAHSAISANSPLLPPAPPADPAGSLLLKDPLDTYLLRLNRHPARRVDAAITSGATAGDITLDYLVAEKRTWFAYAQVSNTGTESTNRYRENIGAAFYQVTDHDDILQVSLGSASIKNGNSASLSYDRPLIFPDYLRIRPFGSYGDFTAKDIALGLSDLKGSSTVGGIEAAWSPVRFGEIAIDLVPGISYQYYYINNKSAAQKAKVELLAPMLSLRAERNTDTMRSALSIGYETNLDDVFDASERSIHALGHPTANLTHDIIRYEFRHSMFIEPLLFGESFYSGENWQQSARAHEIVLNFRGQQTINKDPLIPQKKMTLGGMFTVRGYPESLVSGDNAYVATAEYRVHLPRLFRPYKAYEKDDKTRLVGEMAPAYFGTPFNWRAPTPYSMPDWDIALCFFGDFGQARINQALSWEQKKQTLASFGVGIEFQFSSWFNARLDYGVVANKVTTTYETANRYDSAIHFTASFLW